MSSMTENGRNENFMLHLRCDAITTEKFTTGVVAGYPWLSEKSPGGQLEYKIPIPIPPPNLAPRRRDCGAGVIVCVPGGGTSVFAVL